jgi:tetratricopeptide (TPR) repeat protein
MAHRPGLFVVINASIAVGFALAASSVCAQGLKQAIETCSNNGLRFSMDQVITGCSALISNSRNTPQRAAAYANRGTAYLEQGNSDRALADYNEAIRLDPKLPNPHIGRGAIYRNRGNYDDAVAELTEAIRLRPQESVAYNHRGLAFRGKGDLDRANADYSEAIRLNASSPHAYLNRGDVRRQKGDYEGAIADYTAAIRINPTNGSAYVGRAYAYATIGDAGRAVEELDALLRRDPKNADAYYGRGLIQFTRGNFAPAAEDFLKSSDLRDYAYSFLWRFLSRARQDHDGVAELSASAARLKNKDWPYPVIDFYLGRRSIEELRNSAITADQRCEAHYYTGEWRLLRNDKPGALADLQAAIDMCPKTFSEYMGAVAEKKRLSP